MWHGPARDCLSECAQGSGDQWPYPRDLRLSFGDAFLLARSFAELLGVAFAGWSGDLLGRASPIHPDRDSSLGVVNVRPSVDIAAQRPLLASTLARESCLLATSLVGLPFAGGLQPSARSCHPPDSFRPCRSSRLRRLAPLDIVQVCCALQPTMGFAMFRDIGRAICGGSRGTSACPAGMGLAFHPGLRWPGHPLPVSEEAVSVCFRHAWLTRARVLPRWRHTLRSVSLACSRSTSPWSLPSRRCSRSVLPSACGSCEEHAAGFALVGSSTSGPCSARRVRCVPSTLPPRYARCFHGLLYTAPGSPTHAR
jgi:hypothetical protein